MTNFHVACMLSSFRLLHFHASQRRLKCALRLTLLPHIFNLLSSAFLRLSCYGTDLMVLVSVY